MKEDLSKWLYEKPSDTDQWCSILHWKSCGRLIPSGSAIGPRIALPMAYCGLTVWIGFVSSIPEDLKCELLERIRNKAVEEIYIRGAVSVLAATADTDLAAEVFSRLCTLRDEILTAADKTAQNLREVSGRLEELFRAIPPNVAVSGMISRLSQEFNGIEYNLVIDLFGRIGVEDSDLRSRIEEAQNQLLRNYLKEGVQFTLNQDDFDGHLKAHLALALARVGEPSDMDDVHRLIRADIDRVREGRAAAVRGERGPLTNGATMSWTNWYVRAVSWLDPKRAEETFLDLLYESEYEEGASTALIELSKIQSPEKSLGFHRPDYRLVWEARLGRSGVAVRRRAPFRYAVAIEKRLSTLMANRSESDDLNWFNLRLKKLAQRLAVIDGRNSAEFVMEIMMLPSQWDEWTRADAIEALLFSGARLSVEETLTILNPAIEYALSHFYEQQTRYLLQRCLCFLPFVDPPSTGMRT